jgi:TP901-1 family phage major tail protein
MADPVLFILGMKGKLYYGESGSELSAMTELDNVKDVNGTMSRGEADITTRANSGFKAIAPTLAECSIDFEMVWKPGDTGFDALQAAFFAAGTVEIAALDQDKTSPTASGIKGTFCVTNFSRKEPLAEAMTASVTLKLTKFDAWLPVAA